MPTTLFTLTVWKIIQESTNSNIGRNSALRVLTTVKPLFAPPCLNMVGEEGPKLTDSYLLMVICTREILDPSQQGGVGWALDPLPRGSLCLISISASDSPTFTLRPE